MLLFDYFLPECSKVMQGNKRIIDSSRQCKSSGYPYRKIEESSRCKIVCDSGYKVKYTSDSYQYATCGSSGMWSYITECVKIASKSNIFYSYFCLVNIF